MHCNRFGKCIFLSMVPLSCRASLQLVIAKRTVLAVSDCLFSLASCLCQKENGLLKPQTEGGETVQCRSGPGKKQSQTRQLREAERRGASEKRCFSEVPQQRSSSLIHSVLFPLIHSFFDSLCCLIQIWFNSFIL